MTTFVAPDADLIWRRKDIPSPLEVLGINCAVWLESVSGTGAGPNVTPWVNRIPNGDAVQSVNPVAPVLLANAFGRTPAVSFQSEDAGLILTVGTPWGIGDRPYMWTRAKLNRLVHTFGDFQPLCLLGTAPAFLDTFVFSGIATGAFDTNAYWDFEAFTNGTANDTFETLVELDLLPHTFQCACQQAGALVVDGRVFDAATPIDGFGSAVDTVWLCNNAPAGAPPGTAGGFWDVGVLVLSYTQPTADQISAVAEYCNTYATIL